MRGSVGIVTLTGRTRKDPCQLFFKPPRSNDDDHFIEMSEIARCWPHAAQFLCDRRAEFEKSAPHALVGNIKAPLRKQILYISIAESEPAIEPNRVANNIRWKLMASKRDVIHLERPSQMPLHVLPVNVTMPAERNRFGFFPLEIFN
jgi:hypothetical protein